MDHWSTGLRIVCGGPISCKLLVWVRFSRREVFSSHREAVGRLEIEMEWDKVVERQAEVLVTLRRDSQHWSILLIAVRIVTLHML